MADGKDANRTDRDAPREVRVMVRDRPVSEQARVCDAGDTMTDRDALIARLREESQWFGSRHWGDRGFREHGESATALMQQAADALAALPPLADPPLCEHCQQPLACPGEQAERIAGLEAMHDEALTRAEKAEAKLDHVRRQAGIWKQEARTQKATVDGVGAVVGLPDYGPIVAAVEALARRPADPPTLVALVREWQVAMRAYPKTADVAGLVDAQTALLAYPLPAAPPVTDTPQGLRAICDEMVREARAKAGGPEDQLKIPAAPPQEDQ